MVSNELFTKESTKSGEFTLKCNNLYLHSKFYPTKEAIRFVEEHYHPATVQILIGYGAGYIYRELKNKVAANEKILVIDPLLPLEELEHTIILNNFDEKEIVDFLNNYIQVVDTVNLIVSINYDKLLAGNTNYKKFITLLKETINSNTITENTIQYFNDKWNENYLKNLQYAHQDHPIRELFSNRQFPVVVASGGPSLTKQLNLLKQYRNKIILVAAGTTINSLLAENIEPDLVVSVDGGEVNFKHFEKVKGAKFPLVYCPTVHPGVRNSFSEAYYCFLTMEEQLIPHYESYTNKVVDKLIGGSSVANTAYNLALYLSDGPVALIGQDLAYTNGKSHAEGNLNRENTSSKNTCLREGYDGQLVETNQVFLQMRDGFDLIQSKLQAHNRTYNCTEGGLKIHSMNQLSFETFLTEFALETTNVNYHYEEIYKDLKVYKDHLMRDEKMHLKLIRLFKDALAELEKNKSEEYYGEGVLNRLEVIDQSIMASLEFSNLQYAFSIVNLHVLKYFKVSQNATEVEKYQASFKQSSYMYSEMLRISRKSLQTLRGIMKEG